MKYTTKTVLWLVSVLTLLSLMLAACAKPSPAPEAKPEQPTEEAAEEPTQEATPVPEEEITLTVWTFGGIEFLWMDKIAIPNWEEKHPNIKINHVGVPEDELGMKLSGMASHPTTTAPCSGAGTCWRAKSTPCPSIPTSGAWSTTRISSLQLACQS